jgi:hypothetical protein
LEGFTIFILLFLFIFTSNKKGGKMKRLIVLTVILIISFSVLMADSWNFTGEMNIERGQFAAIRLNDGRVLAAGGYNKIKSCEIYNPETNTWELTGSMHFGRHDFTLAKLPNGNILASGSHIQSEIYDPNTETWQLTDSLNYFRSRTNSISLLNGKILIVGGDSENGCKGCEIYDPNTETWQLTGFCNYPKDYTVLKKLDNGKVIAGGFVSTFALEIYDPNTETWQSLPQPNITYRMEPTMDILEGNKILIVGGVYGNNTGEIYDFNTNEWTFTPDLEKERIGHSSNKLINGKVIVMGGAYSDWVAEIYNPVFNQWSQTANMLKRRAELCSVVLKNEKVLAIAGRDYGANAEIYTWNNMPEIENIDYPDQIVAGQNVYFTFTVSDSNQDSISYKIDFGDGTTLDWSNLVEPGDFVVFHIYQDTGEYTLSIQACDQWYFENPQTHNSLSDWTENLIEVGNSATSPQINDLEKVKIFPNPFNPTTSIEFSLPHSSKVELAIYNLKGQVVKTLVNRNLAAGKHIVNWNGKDSAGDSVSSGVYFYKLQTDSREVMKKMILRK